MTTPTHARRSRASRLDPYGIDEITLTLEEWRAARLPFPPVDDGWRIDADTRRRGRRGVAEARAALDAATGRRADRRQLRRAS